MFVTHYYKELATVFTKYIYDGSLYMSIYEYKNMR